ncbi:sigma-54-dependent Fis family transcriptional regulator [Isachenkonia alkalipeptolytica]|uniref:sigma-54-dependent Fis family transcriptional regulator n=1 Tax=Isachenkonia alkalipeptolytica TaxID=2565777 RepID=UPI00136B2A80|nr:sigma-54-dependent Fis family transcriptional regulator [Isachenkonia alkalipeptolytica]
MVLLKSGKKRKEYGIITLRDLSISKDDLFDFDQKIEDKLSTPIEALSDTTTVKAALKAFEELQSESLPVESNGQLVGVVRKKDFFNRYFPQLYDMNHKYKDIINHMHEAVSVIDQNGYVRLWNKQAEELYQIPREKIVNEKMSVFFPNALGLKILETRKAIKNVYYSPKEDYYVSISSLPVYINKKFIGVVSTEKDLTQQKNLTTKLENANSKITSLQQKVAEIHGYSNSFFDDIKGHDPILLEKIELAKYVSKTNTNVLITGESGTGKELFAKGIHGQSGREGAFVSVNCSAIPHGLFESEFFGYEDGAFTGAIKGGKAGYFKLSDKGTLFLDEVGELPLELQAKLLRVLDEQKVSPLGSEQMIPVDVRIIAATNRNMKQLVENEQFRHDLYYRLNVVEIDLPPLRKRIEDIVILFHQFLEAYSKENNIEIKSIDPEIYSYLKTASWEGNIRELRNTVEYLVVLSKNGIIKPEALPDYIKEQKPQEVVDTDPVYKNLEYQMDHFEKVLIERALEINNYNKSKTAKYLEIPRSTLYYKLEKHELE